jgi:rhodanese-related sulfurtransferase
MAQVIQRALSIVVLGAVLGLLSNAIVPRGIPLVTPPKKVAKPEEFIPLLTAREMWDSGTTLFFDARKPEDFEAGHIAKALNLPAEQFEEQYPKVAPLLTPESPIIVYCDGEECDLSHRLVEQLRPQGYTNVLILSNGWTAWHAAGYPVETNSVK